MRPEVLPQERWRRVKALFDEALAVSSAPEQLRLVTAATIDPEVRDEVLSLLAAHKLSLAGHVAPEQPLLEVGQRLGPYEIRAHVGGGGMGEVYRAHDTRLERDVAVKVLRGRLTDEASRARFQREARAIAALSHPNVLAIHDVGDEGGVPYLVTELLVGETLRARLMRGAPALATALEWGVQIAIGLAAAHEAGIVHRDLKPENVFLLADGRVKILDFGLARPLRRESEEPIDHTLPGMIVGTAGYLAPEQARGLPAAPPVDLFALGAILFELCTGSRAFRGENLVETLHAVVSVDPPPVSSLRPEAPPWVDRVVARCLSKEPAQRFASARDLAFALGAPLGSSDGSGARPAPSPRARRAVRWGVAGIALVAGTIGGIAAPWPHISPEVVAPPREPARTRALTFSGRDSDPSVSPDGKFMAFTSDRDGRPRIWLQQLEGGRETPLTDGHDRGPRFSPDGAQLLFTRAHRTGTALVRVGLLGGDVRTVVDDATDGDWSPDGRRVTFVRWSDAAQSRATLMSATIDGSDVRALATLGDYRIQVRPRWSPDGKTIAVTGIGQQPGVNQGVLLVPAGGGAPRILRTPSRVGLVSNVAWEGNHALLYSQALSVTGNAAGGESRIVRQRVDDGATTTLLWSMDSSFGLDLWPGKGVVFDARSPRENLREVALRGGRERVLSRGTGVDRQPIVSPDGERVLFSTNRGGNLDVWMVGRRSGETRRLTDHPADDWDPGLTPDGEQLLWSSNRSGNFEVWVADADGARPRQLTHDGASAENPTATADGAWIVYSSGAPGHAGVWRIRPDGSDARLLVPGVILPEVSPDGQHVLFQTNRSPRLAVVGVARISDGEVLPFEIRVEASRPPPPILGRARWMPDGKSIAFIGENSDGRTGVYLQRFAPGEDTTGERVPLAGFDGERQTESFGVAPDGASVVLADAEQRSAVVAATGLGSGGR